MNGRIHNELTPESRIAAAIKTLQLKFYARFKHRNPEYRIPDYADYRDHLKPFIDRELAAARLDELLTTGKPVAIRRIELAAEIAKLDLAIELLQ